MIKKILVGLAGTEYTTVAIRRAVELAKIHSAEVTGVTVMDPQNIRTGPVPAGAAAAAKELRLHRIELTTERINTAIQSFEDVCTTEKIPFEIRRESGNAFRLMQDLAKFNDLTIFGLRSVFEYYFENTDSSTLLARLLGEGVRPILATSKHYRPIHRVLLAYSGSMESAKTIRRFIQGRLWPDLALKIVTFGGKEKDAREKLEEAAHYCNSHGFETELEYLTGSPSSGLLEHADTWDADLIVLGNSVRSFWRRRIFGDTAIHTIQHADRPLFLSN